MAQKSKAREYAESLVIAAIIALLVRGFVVQAFRIPSGSMEPTLLVGDHLLVNRLSYVMKLPFTDTVLLDLGSPKRGDVVVFRYPQDRSKDFIKRVIGIGGDTVEIRNKVVYVNGRQRSTGRKPRGGAWWPRAQPRSGHSRTLDNVGEARHRTNRPRPRRSRSWIRTRRGRPVHLSRLSLSHRQCAADELSSPAIDPADAGLRARRERTGYGSVPSRGRVRVPVLLLRHEHVHRVTVRSKPAAQSDAQGGRPWHVPGFVRKQEATTAAVASIEDVGGVRARADACSSACWAGSWRSGAAAGTALDYVRRCRGRWRANCWELSAMAGHEGPHRMQALLRRYRWPWEEVRARCRRWRRRSCARTRVT